MVGVSGSMLDSMSDPSDMSRAFPVEQALLFIAIKTQFFTLVGIRAQCRIRFVFEPPNQAFKIFRGALEYRDCAS